MDLTARRVKYRTLLTQHNTYIPPLLSLTIQHRGRFILISVYLVFYLILLPIRLLYIAKKKQSLSQHYSVIYFLGKSYSWATLSLIPPITVRNISSYISKHDELLCLSTLCRAGDIIIFHNQGKLAEGEEKYKRALAGRQQTIRINHSLTLTTINKLTTINNLRVLYYNQGKLDKAEQIYKRALTRRELFLGLDYRLTLDSVNNLGTIYFK